MDNWIVQPLEDINGIKFGMKREEVRKRITGIVREFRKSKFSKTTTDDFGFFHVFYDSDDRCEAVEIFEEITVRIDEKIVFPNSIDVIKTIFTDMEEDDENYISKKYSVGICAPSGKVESILFGKKDYYI